MAVREFPSVFDRGAMPSVPLRHLAASRRWQWPGYSSLRNNRAHPRRAQSFTQPVIGVVKSTAETVGRCR